MINYLVGGGRGGLYSEGNLCFKFGWAMYNQMEFCVAFIPQSDCRHTLFNILIVHLYIISVNDHFSKFCLQLL